MAVDKTTSIRIVQAELAACAADADLYGWEIFPIDEEWLTFDVKMFSKVDGEIYLIEMTFDNYNEIPLFIEFIDPTNGQRGTKNAYPMGPDSFFHSNGLICNPCSRKAYADVHKDWDMAGWRQNPKTSGLTKIGPILSAISGRINDREYYTGRMK